jgi:hypothetical protein
MVAILTIFAVFACGGGYDSVAGTQGGVSYPDTVWHGALDNPSTPTSYGSYEAACRAACRIIARTLGDSARHAQWRKTTMWFQYMGDSLVFSKGWRGSVSADFEGPEQMDSVATLRMEYSDSKRQSGDDAGLSDAMRRAGWAELGEYNAEGVGGRNEVFACREAYCAIQVSWPEVDDDDSTATAPDEPLRGIWLQFDLVPSPSHGEGRHRRGSKSR